MPLQNRVTPNAEIVADPARGTLTGNRGILHVAPGVLGPRRWTSKAWIACAIEFKARRRQVMNGRTWTELFFLDEATAFAAGHRPCAECRRAAYDIFRTAWAAAHPNGTSPRANEIDKALHAERVERSSRRQVTHERTASELPDGTFIRLGNECWLIHDGRLHLWSPGGYRATRPVPPDEVTVLTPASLVAVMASGYRAALHPSANAADQDVHDVGRSAMR